MNSDLTYHFAIALVRSGKKAGTLEALAKDLDRVVRLIAAERRAKFFLVHPLIPLAEKDKFLKSICETEVVRKLVLLLVETKTLDLADAVSSQFSAMVGRELGTIKATVETASALSEADRLKLEAALSEAVRSKVALETRIDPSVLAGVRIRVGDTVIDNTIETELQMVRERLAPQ